MRSGSFAPTTRPSQAPQANARPHRRATVAKISAEVVEVRVAQHGRERDRRVRVVERDDDELIEQLHDGHHGREACLAHDGANRDAEHRGNDHGDREEELRAPPGERDEVFRVVAGRDARDRMEGDRREQRAQHRRREHEPDAEREIAFGVLRPRGRRARDRHRTDHRETDQEVLHLVRVVPDDSSASAAASVNDRGSTVFATSPASATCGRATSFFSSSAWMPSEALKSKSARSSVGTESARVAWPSVIFPADTARSARPGPGSTTAIA